MKFLIGTKLEMSQKFLEDGTVIPITYVKAGPCVVTDIKTPDRDGYLAVQVGFGKTKHIAKPQSKLSELYGPVNVTREYRVEKIDDIKCGDVLNVERFAEGDLVNVTGESKGKGFTGVVKRHKFAGQVASHGTKDQERKSGSIGSQGPQRVLKGLRMAGRSGGNKVTVKNLKVISIDKELGMIAISGAVPGARGGLVLIEGSDDRRIWK
jgi:large subunit ribosomal protein L3